MIMNMSGFFRGAIAGIALTLAAPHAVAAEMTRGEVEKIVREYLVSNPEILNDMLSELKRRESAGAEERARVAITSNKDALYNDGYSYVAGNPNGDVVMVEFFDYRCGYCRKVRDDVLTLLKDDGNVRIVMKEFPILGETSREAARAAIASKKQGDDKYWAFHNALLGTEGLDSAAIYDVAAGQGIDVARLKEDMKSAEVEDIIARNHALGEKIGVDGTPAFIIGETLYPGALGADELKSLAAAQRGN